ncbi:MAG: ATP-binding cassette domain-containing protein [Cryobacterium sp.]|nr:ATP-binding cassette domain-containing protein [Oligoflexia bacterium]
MSKTPAMAPVISVNKVRRSFRSAQKGEGLKGTFELLLKPKFTDHHALKETTFTIEPGSFVGLIGANGAGKTTLLKILAGLIPPSSGEAKVLGFTPFDRTMEFRHAISLVMGQKAQLWWDLPATDAFDLLKAIYEIPEDKYRERLETLSELLDVKRLLQTQIRRLSLGERMKMELIGALLHWPKVIFLDEPTIGLDVLAAEKLRDFLKTFNQKEKATIILTSHNMDDIERLCSRVMILKSGEMIFDGSPNRLVREGECRLRIRLKETFDIPTLSQITGIAEANITAVSENDDAEEDEDEKEESADSTAGGAEGPATIPTFYFETTKEAVLKILQALMGKGTVLDMGIEEQSLESVIQRIYADGVVSDKGEADVRV